MKKTLKKLVSLIAVAATLATSSVVALADNDYISYSNDFSSATGVTVTDNLNYNSAQRGDIVMAVENGVLKTTRTHYDYETSGYRSNSAKASIALGKSFSEKGTIQAKFDFTFDEDTTRSFGFVFDGYHAARGDAGVVISKSHARLLRTNGASTWLPFNKDESDWIQGGVTYTATITLDIATARYTISVVNKANPADAKSKSAVFDWGGTEAGPITGVAFYSARTEDKGTGTITFDNLSVDAYTDSNYEVNSIYRGSNGLETNKQMDGYTFKGMTVSKLTNIPAPANASFITASYDGEGRMLNAVAKKLSEIGTTPVNADVTGDTKSFVLDMSNANPLAPVYQYAEPATTMRKLDFEFENGYKVGDPYQKGVTANFVNNIETWGISYNNTWAGVGYETVLDGDNKALRVERSVFKSGSTYYYYKDGAWVQDTIGAENNNLTIKFDKTAEKTKLTFRFKFAGTENASQIQRIAILMGAQTVHISRDQAGSGGVNIALSGTGCSWTDMKADEWYTFTGEITTSGFTCSVAGNFDSGYAVKNGTSTKAGSAISRIEVGSPRDLDTISMSLTDVKTPTSVWYIDDIVVEY